MPADIPDSDPELEPEWLWGTRVTAEAARVALDQGRTPQERFEIFERLILAAFEARRQQTNGAKNGGPAAGETPTIPGKTILDYLDGEDPELSGFDGTGNP